MAIEIERKFLVDPARWTPRDGGTPLVQGYFTARDGGGRVRRAGDRGWVTFKSPARDGGLTRDEFEFEIPGDAAQALLDRLCGPDLIVKTRHLERWGGHEWAIDVFAGANAGLVLAEIELRSEDEAFERPPWLRDEVSHDPRYLNARLCREPFTHWGRTDGVSPATLPGLDEKMARLDRRLRELGSVLIGFSGGTDSTFLAAAARNALGRASLAVTVEAPVHTRREVEAAAELARALDLPHRILKVDRIEDPRFLANPPDRCYYCKTVIFRGLKALAGELGLKAVADGSNVDDTREYRPGRKALEELGVVSPLAECGFTKEDVRAASRRLALPTADLPSATCLATRIPYGTPITRELLARIEKAEESLHALGFRAFRVRVHGDLARLELREHDLVRALDPEVRAKVRTAIEAVGFKHVTLDLGGYRRGCFDPTPAAPA